MSKPNIVFIMSDDHAAHAISAYGSRINQTPHIDRIAEDGMRFDNCFCTNSICAPSRATILTGTYSHVNGVEILGEPFDGRQVTFPKLLQQAGYQTAVIGKWHLGHGGVSDPTGFDYWDVLPGQGLYHNPEFIKMGETSVREGYVTDLITDYSLEWLGRRDEQRPFCLLCHHKAPHRRWEPDAKHAQMYEDMTLPEPATFHDDYSNRGAAAAAAEMRVDRDLDEKDLKVPPPEGLSEAELKSWKYQRYIKDYLRCVAAVDDGVGRMLDYLDEQGLAENTIVIYTSDQGFFLGDHNWYDKRFMYEESLRMPFLVCYPGQVAAGSVNEDMILNVDFAPTFLEYAGMEIPGRMQGASICPLLAGETPTDWRDIMYYRYFMHQGGHNVYAHYGVRTNRYKLIYYYRENPGPQEWELFDLQEDPAELMDVHDEPRYADTVEALKARLAQLRSEFGDETDPWVE